MRFDIITIFPHIFDSYLNEAILKRAQWKKLVEICVHDLRDFTTDKRRTVDDRPYGGGPGMILKIEPIARALKNIPRMKHSHTILLDPRGTLFSQDIASRFSKLDQLIFIAGRYEGVDERVKKLVDQSLSIGPYVLSGGELAAMVVVEAVSRLVPGVLGDQESPKDETFSKELDYVEYPQYTRPEVWNGWRVPVVLLSGNHDKIEEWKKKKVRQTKRSR